MPTITLRHILLYSNSETIYETMTEANVYIVELQDKK